MAGVSAIVCSALIARVCRLAIKQMGGVELNDKKPNQLLPN